MKEYLKKRCGGTFTSRYQISHLFTSHPLKTRKSHKIIRIINGRREQRGAMLIRILLFFKLSNY